MKNTIEEAYKIVRRAQLSDGTRIQLEKWLPDCVTLAAYPIAKQTGIGFFAPVRGKTFRLELNFKTEEQTSQAFIDLLSGAKSFKDFRENTNRPQDLDLI